MTPSERQRNGRIALEHSATPRKRGTILVPTDFTDAAHAALEHAKIMAKNLRADIVIFHVIQPGYAEGLMDATQKRKFRASAQRRDLKKLDFVARAESTPQAPITSMVRVGLVEYEILQTAQELHAEMIVLGRQNRNPLSRMIFGSVTADVVDAASCPVLVINVSKGASPDGHPRVQRIASGWRRAKPRKICN